MGAGKELPVLVGHQYFGQESAGERIYRARRAVHFSLEALAGQFGKSQGRLIVRLDHLAVSLRQTDVDAQRISPGQTENFPGRSRRDQRAGIHRSNGDDAREGRDQFLKVRQFLQALDVGLLRLHTGFAGMKGRHPYIGVLL